MERTVDPIEPHLTVYWRQRRGCKECGGHVTFLEAVEVEELEGVEEPDQGVIMVQARVVARLRGGKRKR